MPAEEVPWIDFQKTRASKVDPCTRYYRPEELDLVAACLQPCTERWEFAFAPARELDPHPSCEERLSNNVRINGRWMRDPLAVLPRTVQPCSTSQDCSGLSPNEKDRHQSSSLRCLSPCIHSRFTRQAPKQVQNTGAEVLLRKTLWSRGIRYRLHASDLPGKPDIVFPNHKVAVFVDGDFWHGRNWQELEKKLKHRANPDYWLAKIEYNRSRDLEQTAALQGSRVDGHPLVGNGGNRGS